MGILLSAQTTLPAGRVFALDSQTLIQIGAHLVNLILLTLLMSWLLYKPVRHYMLARNERITNQLKFAEDEMEKAIALKNTYEENIRHIELERERLIEAAQRETAELRAQILADARAEAESLRAEASALIVAEKKRVADEMRQVIVDLSFALAQRTITVHIDEDTHDRLFADAVAELEAASWWE